MRPLLLALALLGLACAAPTRDDDGDGPSCSDDVKNGDEADVDCGGSCGACANGATCGAGKDCASATCTGGKCAKGADCASVGDEAFCAQRGKTCGSAVGVDNCGELRTVRCGDDCAVPVTCNATSGVPDGVSMGALSDAQATAICDFTACGWGGYGQTVKCGDSLTINGPKDVATCKTKLPKCPELTVGELLACQKAAEASPCDSLNILFTNPVCAKVKSCAVSPPPSP